MEMRYYLSFISMQKKPQVFICYFFPDFFKGKWQHNIDNMIIDIMNILDTETRTALYCAVLQCLYTTLHYRMIKNTNR